MSSAKYENKADEPPPYGWQNNPSQPPPPPPPPIHAFRLPQMGQNERGSFNSRKIILQFLELFCFYFKTQKMVEYLILLGVGEISVVSIRKKLVLSLSEK